MSERDEWGSAVRALTEVQRDLNITEPRRARGIIGDPEDAQDD